MQEIKLDYISNENEFVHLVHLCVCVTFLKLFHNIFHKLFHADTYAVMHTYISM
jgi:hypothetical protein